MSEWSESKLPAMEDLSALVDGELDAPAVGRLCSQWRDNPETRAHWHAYHLIGDVLRSDNLASKAGHDAAFLAAIQQRLAQEPVVLAPAPQLPVVRRRSWAAPFAVAAGFAAVAGVLVVTQMPEGMLRGMQPDASLAAAPSPAPGVVAVADGFASGVAGDPPTVVLNGQLIRDARLDEYLSAHKKFGGSSVPGGPSGFLRNAAVDGTAR